MTTETGVEQLERLRKERQIDVLPHGFEVVEFKVDPRIPVVELCGVRYQMELFHVMACGEPGAIFQIVDKGDGLRGVASVLGLAEMLGRVKELEGIVARKSALINRLVEEMHKRQGTA